MVSFVVIEDNMRRLPKDELLTISSIPPLFLLQVPVLTSPMDDLEVVLSSLKLLCQSTVTALKLRQNPMMFTFLRKKLLVNPQGMSLAPNRTNANPVFTLSVYIGSNTVHLH